LLNNPEPCPLNDRGLLSDAQDRLQSGRDPAGSDPPGAELPGVLQDHRLADSLPDPLEPRVPESLVRGGLRPRGMATGLADRQEGSPATAASTTGRVDETRGRTRGLQQSPPRAAPRPSNHLDGPATEIDFTPAWQAFQLTLQKLVYN